ncbi:MAG: DNA polymerase [Methanothrix soehngenii]|nr:DNA polymerase [Methanothrix soehngenii]
MSLLTIWAPGCINPVSLYHSQSEPKKRPSSQATLSGAGDLPQAFPLSLDVIEVHGQEVWASALQEVEAAGICGLDLETTGLDPLSCRARLAQLSLPSGRVYVADLWELEQEGLSPLQDLGQLSERSDIKKVGHNLKFDLAFIQASQGQRLHMSDLFDTMLASQVCWAGYFDLLKAPKATKNLWKQSQPEHNLKALAERHLGLSLSKELQASNWGAGELSPEQIAYAARDAGVLLPLHAILQELLQRNNLEHIAELEFRALPSVIELELQGLPLDAPACRQLLKQKEAQAKTLTESLQAEAQKAGFQPRRKKGKKYSPLLNPASSQDVLAFLQVQGYKIGSTKEEDLKELSQAGCSFAGDLLQYRRLARQGKFLEDWLLKLSPIDSRLHPGYYQLASRAGRFSSKAPNAQQIPKRGEDGQAMRKLFKAPPGKKLIKADFSGIELRIMARLSQDKTMIEAFQNGQDLHKLTASRLAGVPLDQVTKAQRQSAKSANFGLIYGVSAPRFKENAKNEYGIEMSLEDAEKVRDAFFSTYPGVASFHLWQKTSKRYPKNHFFHNAERGFYSSPLVCSSTLAGRKRVWGWKDGRTLARDTELYNSPSQGTGADLLKAVMAEVYSSLPEEVKMIGSVHDELILEAPEALAQDMASLLLEIMRRVGSELLSPVPVDAEVEVLDSWGG